MTSLDMCADNVVSFEAAQLTLRRNRPVDREQLPSRQETRDLRRQIEAAREYIGCLGALAEAMDHESGEVEIVAILDRALTQVIAATSASAGALLILDEDDGSLVRALAHGGTGNSQLAWKPIGPGHGICQWVAEHGNSAIINDTSADARFSPDCDCDGETPARSVLAVPLLFNEKVLGVIELLDKKDSGYFTLNDQSHVALLTHLAASVLNKVGVLTPN